MKKLLLFTFFLGVLVGAQAQNGRVRLNTAMDLATATKSSFANRDSLIGIIRIGQDTTRKNMVVTTYQVFKFRDSTSFYAFQDGLISEMKAESLKAETLRLQAVEAKRIASEIQLDVEADKAKRPVISELIKQ